MAIHSRFVRNPHMAIFKRGLGLAVRAGLRCSLVNLITAAITPLSKIFLKVLVGGDQIELRSITATLKGMAVNKLRPYSLKQLELCGLRHNSFPVISGRKHHVPVRHSLLRSTNLSKEPMTSCLWLVA